MGKNELPKRISCQVIVGFCQLLKNFHFRLLFCLFFIFHLYCDASPERYSVERRIFIGANNEFYFTYLIDSIRLGDEGEWSQGIYICKQSIADNRIAELILIGKKGQYDYLKDFVARQRRAQAQQAIVKEEPEKQPQPIDKTADFDLMSYMKQNNVSWCHGPLGK